MTLHEYVGNLHIHTPYSDGTEYHDNIAEAARVTGLDFIVVTDHNIWVDGVQGYYGDKDTGYVLVLTGEEVHDRQRLPQVNHCLVYEVGREMAALAAQPQALINAVQAVGGLSFLAHPFDRDIPWLPPDGDGIAIPWVNWEVSGYDGLEIWNYMSVWKDSLPTFRQGLRSIYNPDDFMAAPRQDTLALWDKLLAQGRRVVGIGNADAHGTYFSLGPLKRRIFPYDFLFRCVNTHVLTPKPLAGDMDSDRRLLFDALRAGRAFIGYDIPGDTRGFRFTAQGMEGSADMGDSIRLGSGVTLQALAPGRGHIKVICHGEVVAENEDAEALVYTATQPGAYRIEVWKEYRGPNALLDTQQSNLHQRVV